MTEYLDRMPTMHEYAEGKRIDPKLTDLISRADAIEAVHDACNYCDTCDLKDIGCSQILSLKEIPSADAEQVTGKLKSVEISTDIGDESTMSQPNGKLDLISRADVLKYPIRLDHYDEVNGSREFVYGVESVIEYVEALPAADAEQVTSKLKNPCDSLLTDDSDECKKKKSKLEHDRDWIIGCIKHDGFIMTDRFDKANQIILDALSADAVQGEWIWRTDIPIGDGRTSAGYICSNCGKDYWHGDVFDFCPNCGARMTPYKGGDTE